MYIRIADGDENKIHLARWLFSRLVDGIDLLCGHAPHVTSATQFATTWQGLDLTELDDAQRRDILQALDVITRVVVGCVPDSKLHLSDNLDEEGVKLFRGAMRKLRVILDRASH